MAQLTTCLCNNGASIELPARRILPPTNRGMRTNIFHDHRPPSGQSILLEIVTHYPRCKRNQQQKQKERETDKDKTANGRTCAPRGKQSHTHTHSRGMGKICCDFLQSLSLSAHHTTAPFSQTSALPTERQQKSIPLMYCVCVVEN